VGWRLLLLCAWLTWTSSTAWAQSVKTDKKPKATTAAVKENANPSKEAFEIKGPRERVLPEPTTLKSAQQAALAKGEAKTDAKTAKGEVKSEIKTESKSVKSDSIAKLALEVQPNEMAEDSICDEGKFRFTLYKKKAYASYYSDRLKGRRTASGVRFNNHGLTAAHKKLPLGTKVRVVNQANGKSIIVTINDRGPYSRVRDIDLTKRAFKHLANGSGTGSLVVRIELAEEKALAKEKKAEKTDAPRLPL